MPRKTSEAPTRANRRYNALSPAVTRVQDLADVTRAVPFSFKILFINVCTAGVITQHGDIIIRVNPLGASRVTVWVLSGQVDSE